MGKPLKQHNPGNQVRMDSSECLGILIKKEREESEHKAAFCRSSVFKDMVMGKGIQ